MSVQPGVTYKRYVANGIATVYSIPFLIVDAADLMITLNGVEVTTGFTLTGVGEAPSTCTFAAAPTGDLLFQLDMTYQRLDDFQENGDFLASTVNREYDRLWLAIKQASGGLSRCLLVDALEPEGIPPLPLKSARMGRVLAFDALGNPISSNLTLAEIEEQPAGAAASAAAAAASAVQSANSATASANSATSAGTQATNSAASATLAQKWAENPEDVPVTTGPNLYSAHHWANKAAATLASLTARVTALETKNTNEAIYSSGYISLTGGTNSVITHNKGAQQTNFRMTMRAKTANNGFSIGEELPAIPFSLDNTGTTTVYGIQIQDNFSNTYTVKPGAGGPRAGIANKSTGATFTPTYTDWEFRFESWRT